MPKFHYTVISKDNKELTGTINAPDEKTGREELNQLGFSIITIAQLPEEKALNTKEIGRFAFSATDKNLKNISGTIHGQDRYEAYKRLVKEYFFEVQSLIDLNLNEEEQKKQKQIGVYKLQNQLDQEESSTKKVVDKSKFDQGKFPQEQEILQSQVEFVLKKVKEILDMYENKITPEIKEKIKDYVDKILRLKSSTNLDYIRKNCEELLTLLQQSEIFLYKDNMSKDHAKLTLQAKSLMMQLHQKKKAPGLIQKLSDLQNKIISEVGSSNIKAKFLGYLIKIINSLTKEDPQLTSIKNQIKTVNEQIIKYIKIYFSSADADIKEETKESFKNAWQERKKLKVKLAEMERTLKEQQKARPQKSSLENLFSEILNLSGWILAFYLIYYFISIYLTNKDFGLTNIPENLYIFKSNFLKYFLAILFVFYSCLSIKINFFKRNQIATLVITPIFLLSTLVILFNF